MKIRYKLLLNIINLTDNETRELANQLKLPRIPDPCAKLHGDRFVSDKRYFDGYLAGTTTEDLNLDHINSGFFSDYQSLLDTFPELVYFLQKKILIIFCIRQLMMKR